MKIINTKSYYTAQLHADFPEIEFVETIEGNADAQAIIGESSLFVKENLNQLPQLRWIHSLRVGYNNVDVEEIKQRKILFTNAKDMYSAAIAEDVVCKILMDNTNALIYLKNQLNKTWQREYPRKDLTNQTVGILGTGSIATAIAKRLQAFDLKVLGFKRTPVVSMPYFNQILTGSSGLDYVLENSDYLVIALDLNPQTHQLLNQEKLLKLKPQAKLINIARGAIVDEKTLIQLLKSKQISYAGLDVFEKEPLPLDSPLWEMDNVYITPHVSGIVEGNRQRGYELIKANIEKFLDNEILINLVSL